MASMIHVKLDNSLGAAYVGNIVSAILYGVTNVQTYQYYKQARRDPLVVKIVVAVLWVLNTLHLAFICHAIYSYAVTNFANPLAILHPTWSIMASVEVTGLSDLTVRAMFCRRVWALSNHNWILTSALLLIALLCYATSTVFAVEGLNIGFLEWPRISWVLYTSFASGVVADLLLTTTLCTLLKRQRNGMIRTDSLLRVLIAYTINTGAITSLCSICCLAIYANTPPDSFEYFAFYSVLPTLLLNALLGTLNARKTLREDILGDGAHLNATAYPLGDTDTTYEQAHTTRQIRSSVLTTSTGPCPQRPYRQVLVETAQNELRMELTRCPKSTNNSPMAVSMV
ncbi:hypothetical protein CERSUDRAFT_84619 [Gelatoporia subvermispora B]|uniref:DUF6534 domain-containing protein n=1 Tax=Ceriporiopsis subvermispora (strain B) TaxID=914234 RepID=M2QHG6_CERS8|nr:hypothetical protein CERSUDRAFT_84619 [Gelatoporia subvermispora B]